MYTPVACRYIIHKIKRRRADGEMKINEKMQRAEASEREPLLREDYSADHSAGLPRRFRSRSFSNNKVIHAGRFPLTRDTRKRDLFFMDCRKETGATQLRGGIFSASLKISGSFDNIKRKAGRKGTSL